MTILFTSATTPPGKLADAELHFGAEEAALAGLKLVGFAIWEPRGTGGTGRNVTFPSRPYAIHGDRRTFALLRPTNDPAAAARLRAVILAAYADFERSTS